MDDLEISKLVVEAYARRYPKWREVTVTSICPAPSGGYLVVVTVVDPNDVQQEEACFVSGNRVRIFDGTAELTHFVTSSESWKTKIFSSGVIGGLAFLLTLAAVIASVFMQIGNHKGLDALYGLLALAAGFHFGNQTSKGPSLGLWRPGQSWARAL